MKYLDVRVQALDYLVDEHRAAVKGLAKTTKKRAEMVDAGLTQGWEDLAMQHKEFTASVAKTSSTLARLQQRSPLDDKDVEDIARPLTKPIMCNGRWNIIALVRGKAVHLAVKHRHIFQEKKQVFKNLNPTKPGTGLCFKCPIDPKLDPESLSWPKQALSDVPAYALGFLWDAIVPQDHCLTPTSPNGIWNLFEDNAKKMANFWIDGPSGSRFIYGMGVKAGTSTDLHVCIVGGDTHKKNVVAYYFKTVGRYYLPMNVISDYWTPFFVRDYASPRCLMGWSEGRVPSTAKKNRTRFQRVAYPWLQGYDATTLTCGFTARGRLGRSHNVY